MPARHRLGAAEGPRHSRRGVVSKYPPGTGRALQRVQDTADAEWSVRTRQAQAGCCRGSKTQQTRALPSGSWVAGAGRKQPILVGASPVSTHMVTRSRYSPDKAGSHLSFSRRPQSPEKVSNLCKDTQPANDGTELRSRDADTQPATCPPPVRDSRVWPQQQLQACGEFRAMLILTLQ